MKWKKIGAIVAGANKENAVAAGNEFLEALQKV